MDAPTGSGLTPALMSKIPGKVLIKGGVLNLNAAVADRAEIGSLLQALEQVFRVIVDPRADPDHGFVVFHRTPCESQGGREVAVGCCWLAKGRFHRAERCTPASECPWLKRLDSYSHAKP